MVDVNILPCCVKSNVKYQDLSISNTDNEFKHETSDYMTTYVILKQLMFIEDNYIV
jgi:hypothetical protein